MSNALDIAITDIKYDPLPVFPSPRQLRQPLPAIDINVLQFLQLSACDLQRHIGHRNSSLGRVMTATQQLIYEVRFLILARDCLVYMRSKNANSKLLKELVTVIQIKEKHLPLSIWNATLGGREFRKLFSPALNRSTADKPAVLLDALTQLQFSMISFLNINVRTDKSGTALSIKQQTMLNQQLDKLEQYYAVIEAAKHDLGNLLQTVDMMKTYIHFANRAFIQRLARGPVCFQPQPNRQAKILWTVFNQFFVAEVQSQTVALLHSGRETLTIIDELTDILMEYSVVPEFFSEYWQQTLSPSSSASLWVKMHIEFEQHIQLWQTVFKQCGLSPTVQDLI